MMTKASLAFLALTFLFSWGVAIAGWALGAAEAGLTTLVLGLMMAGPALAASVCVFALEARGARLQALGLTGKPNLWWVAAWAIALALAGASVGFTVLFSEHQYTGLRAGILAAQEAGLAPRPANVAQAIPPDSVLILLAITLGAALNAPILTFTEELGWRGYLHHLWRPQGFWLTSILTGCVWGIWHIPAILLFGHNYPDHRALGAGIFIGFCIVLSPLFTLVRDYGRSVLAAGILHGTINAVGSLTVLALGNPAFPWNGIVGIGGFVALALALGAVAALRPKGAAAGA